MSLYKFFFSDVRKDASQNHRLACFLLNVSTAAIFSDMYTKKLDHWIEGKGTTRFCELVESNTSLFSMIFSDLVYGEVMRKARFR